jgi:lincosamide nucleotidyltransferase
VLHQERLIARVRDVCATDERLDAALMYGSFAAGAADAHSDIEFWLFFRPRWHATVDPREWCEQIAPLTHLVRNEFGTDVVFFPGLVRGEFHFASTDDIATVRTWPARGAPVDRMIVLDRGDTLREALLSLPERPAVPERADDIETLCGRFANWLVLAHHLAGRGESLRAWDALGQVHRHLLWMARLTTGNTDHWLTPSRRAEAYLPARELAELRQATAAADPDEVRAALRAAWRSGRRFWTELAERHHRPVPHQLLAEIDGTLK